MTLQKALKSWIWLILPALAGPSGLTSSVATEADAAIVCYIEGQAWVSGGSGPGRRDLQLFDWIAAGAVVELAGGAKLVVAFSNGDRYELQGVAKAKVGPNGLDSDSGPVKKIASVGIMPQIAELAAGSKPGNRLSGIRLRGSSRRIVDLYPADGATALAEETVLSFSPLDGVAKYLVVIDDAGGHSIFSAETMATRVEVSKGILLPGSTYHWSVRTLDEGRPSTSSEASFTTLEEKQAASRNAFRSQVDRSGDASELLLFARLDMALGLRREACQTLQKVLSVHGPNAEVQKALERYGCK